MGGIIYTGFRSGTVHWGALEAHFCGGAYVVAAGMHGKQPVVNTPSEVRRIPSFRLYSTIIYPTHTVVHLQNMHEHDHHEILTAMHAPER